MPQLPPGAIEPTNQLADVEALLVVKREYPMVLLPPRTGSPTTYIPTVMSVRGEPPFRSSLIFPGQPLGPLHVEPSMVTSATFGDDPTPET